jgi:hypothetical protein
MDLQLIALCGLTFVIHLIGTLAYAVRIAGVRTTSSTAAPAKPLFDGRWCGYRGPG